jgi:MoxR-like ATPase
MKIDAVADRCEAILATLAQVIVGKAAVLEQILAGVLANGHILIEDYPGLAKTLIARLFAQALDLRFKRIQCTPDLLPSDITGTFLYDQRQARFEFREGPIFTHLLLADEINRATPKTQSALLEAMQETQVTVDGERFPLEPPFLVMATQNPIELEGTYPLPEAQLDRFLMRVAVGYPDHDDEVEILTRRRLRRDDAIAVSAVTSRAELLAMQAAMEDVHVAAVIERYIVELVRATRSDHRLALGASPRGALALLKLARGLATLRRREFVLPDDVKAMAVPALAHRLILKPELWASQVSATHIVQDLLATVPAPGPDAR